MGELFSYLLIAALVAVTVVLLFGVVNMARGGGGSSQRSNKLMRWRIGFQFAALVIIVLFFIFGQKG